MNYNKQIDTLVQIFAGAAKKEKNYKIGVEIEHFVLDNKLKAVQYNQQPGIHTILKKLSQKNWQPRYEKNNIIELKKNDNKISLEPGGQIELSIKPVKKISIADKIYRSFLKDLTPIINNYDYKLMTAGFQPITGIQNIELTPKERYRYMHKYLSRHGELATSMMRGTASLQVNIDYSGNKDYHKKNYVAAYLVPIIYSFFDNSPLRENKPVRGGSLRAEIWANTDSDRCGIIENLYQPGSGYRNYAEFLLQTPPIIIKREGKLIYTGSKPATEVVNFCNQEEVNHFLSMVFPEVRSKRFLEIRSADSLPYPQSMGYTALIKNIFYSKKNLNYVYKKAMEINFNTLLELQNKVRKSNLPQKIQAIGKDIFHRVISSSPATEREYLEYIAPFFRQGTNPRTLTRQKLKQNDLHRALSWCMVEGESNV
ncbi:MAG: glutamate-cysteine ligase family protein [Halanaerobiales bacterium]